MGLSDEMRDWRLASANLAECGRLYHRRLSTQKPIAQPLVLISQVQRSGGTLLSQLFDGHPQCHAYPHELHCGHPQKQDWPNLDLSEPKSWNDKLRNTAFRRAFRHGYGKYSSGADGKGERFPFLLPPRLQRQLFEECVAQLSPKTQREIMNCYFTAFFHAWLDNQNLYGDDKRLLVAFAADTNLKSENLDGFFRDYPDGVYLSIVRDPRSWFASARKHHKQFADMKSAISLWTRSTQNVMNAREKYGEKVILLTFDDLLSDTEGIMRVLSARLGLDFLPSLLQPTFNRFPIKADSSFQVKDYGVLQDPLTRYKKVLGEDELQFIDAQTSDLHQRAQSIALRAADS